ncbi:MAG: DUF1566 domain-containing protein [Methylobacter sp.]|nr:MAG: DUF1566 domain-containing protein [Methylobacter sp.]
MRQPNMFKHPVRALSYAVLLFFSLSYPITSVAALALKATTGDQQVTLQWGRLTSATNYGVCYATETISDINNCLNYADGTWQDITKTRLVIGKLTNGKKYYFRVLAENSVDTLEISATIDAIPIPNKAYGLNDTGITTCSDGANNKLPCPVDGYPNQDAESGRDIAKSNNSNGHAGFDFTKISSTGAALAANAKTWNCVKDNVTGLMWEVKTDDNGLHDKNWRYSWYEPDNSKNGGNVGAQNGGSCGSTSACDTDAYVKAVNAAGWCGYKDWRIPRQAELHSIVDYSRYKPAINTRYFPNTVKNARFWSSSSLAYDSSSAWIVYFYDGGGGLDGKDYGDYVRLVRSGQ